MAKKKKSIRQYDTMRSLGIISTTEKTRHTHTSRIAEVNVFGRCAKGGEGKRDGTLHDVNCSNTEQQRTQCTHGTRVHLHEGVLLVCCGVVVLHPPLIYGVCLVCFVVFFSMPESLLDAILTTCIPHACMHITPFLYKMALPLVSGAWVVVTFFESSVSVPTLGTMMLLSG